MAQHIEYYIDNVLQDYTPELPNPNIVIVLNDTACIGYADTVDRSRCQFKVYTDATTPEEDTADYNEFTACNV